MNDKLAHRIHGLIDAPTAREYERGRQMALNAMRVDPEAKRRVEDAYGIPYCQDRYPELYGINRLPRVYEPDHIVTFTPPKDIL